MSIGIGFHITDGMFSQQAIAWWYDWVLRLQPGYINIFRASQQREALDAALMVARTTPTRVMVRNYYRHANGMQMKDEDVMKLYPGSGGQSTLNAAGRYYADWIVQYAGTNLIPVTCNEISLSDYSDYSLFFGEIIRLADLDDIQVAVGRFPTHHPLEGTWDSLEPLWVKMRTHGNAFYSPNGYWMRGEDDGLRKQVRLLDYMAARLDNYYPITVFGEYGILRDVKDAWNGWANIPGMTERLYAVEAIDKYKSILQPRGIQVDVFDIGNWKESFGIGGPFMTELEMQKDSLQVVPMAQENAVVVTPRSTQSGAYVNVRVAPNGVVPEGNEGKLFVGETARSLEPEVVTRAKLANTEKTDWINILGPRNNSGYVAAWVVKEVAVVPEPEPEPEPSPDPVDPDLEWLTAQMAEVKNKLALHDGALSTLAEEILLLQTEKVDSAAVWTIVINKIKSLIGMA